MNAERISIIFNYGILILYHLVLLQVKGGKHNFLGKHNSHKTTSEKKAVAPRRHKWEDPNFRRAAFHRCIWPWLRPGQQLLHHGDCKKKHGPFLHGPWSDV